MAFDTAGNLYVTNGANDTISKVTPTGTVSTFVSGLCGSLAFDAAGNLYVSNAVDNTISKVTLRGQFPHSSVPISMNRWVWLSTP